MMHNGKIENVNIMGCAEDFGPIAVRHVNCQLGESSMLLHGITGQQMKTSLFQLG
jgi:hypothetical protein